MEQVETDAFVGDAIIFVGNGNSPETFVPYCAVTEVGDISETNDLVEVTTLCSGGVKQYVGGLSDGASVDLTANFELSNEIQDGLIASQKAKEKRNFEVRVGPDSGAKRIFSFRASIISWGFALSSSKQNVLKIGVKISSAVDYT